LHKPVLAKDSSEFKRANVIITIDPDSAIDRSISMRLIVIALLTTLAAPAMAADYVRVSDRGAFVALVSGKSLTSLGVSLSVSPSGSISGRAFGSTVTGTWTWTGGYFCRTLKAGDRVFARNCQLVQQKPGRIRFTADKGVGDTADLRIR
jgi:hypothetical protein